MVNDDWIFGLLVIWMIIDIWDLRPYRLKKVEPPVVADPPPKFSHPVKTMSLAEKTQVLQEIAGDRPTQFSQWETEFIGSLKERTRYSPKQLSKIDELIYRSYAEAVSEEE